jgi:hypothetical protein
MTPEILWDKYVKSLMYVSENDILFNRLQSRKCFDLLLTELAAQGA